MALSDRQPAAAEAAATVPDFETVFKTHFKGLHAYAISLLRDDVMAEEMVQNVFCRLWEKDGLASVKGSVAAYLYRSVYHECLNYIKHLKVRATYQAHVMRQPADSAPASERVQTRELEQRISQALQELPEQCRTIFQMSRYEELRYAEIAQRLGLSVKTIENQMGKALRLMRSKLADLLPVLTLMIVNLLKRML